MNKELFDMDRSTRVKETPQHQTMQGAMRTEHTAGWKPTPEIILASLRYSMYHGAVANMGGQVGNIFNVF